MRLFFLSILILATSLLNGANLLINPTTGKLAGNPLKAGYTCAIEGDDVNLTIDGGNVTWGTDIPLSPTTKYLRLRTKMRLHNVVRGNLGWENSRLAMRFCDAKGNPVGDWPDVIGGDGTCDWTDFDRIYRVPQGAAKLQFGPSNFGKSGKAEFFKLKMESFDEKDKIDMDEPPPNGEKPETIASISDAWRQTTPTREKISLNGLWQFRPVFDGEKGESVPEAGSGWGYFKVPGGWPSYAMKPYLSAFALAKCDINNLNSAWYQRKFEIPADWAGRKIVLNADLIQTCAKVFIDGKDSGEFYYPGGELDLTGKLVAGKMHTLSIIVNAYPEATVNYMAPGRIVEQKSELANRGITGDLYLESMPVKSAVSDVHVVTSVKNMEISLDVGFSSAANSNCKFEAEISKDGKVEKKIVSDIFNPSKLSGDRFVFSDKWSNPALWDTDAPQNLYTLKLKLTDENGKLIDEFLPQEFGFREFAVQGRDFYLNGKKIHLRMLVAKTPQEPDLGSKTWVKHMNKVAKETGVNFIIGWNYSFAPGIFSYPAGFHKYTSEDGILTSLTLPHVKDFKNNLDDPANAREYRRQSEHLIRRYQNIPGLIMFVMNHNAMGYNGDQNPARLGTENSPESVLPADSPSLSRRKQAKKSEMIAKSIDSTRPVYHHESGNLGDVYTINCYLNWAPRQERSDWLAEWDKNGTRPVIFVEWGLPHIASWSSFRGPQFIWRYEAHQCVWVDEFNSAILGEKAYKSQDAKIKLLENEEKMIKGNKPVHFGRINGRLDAIDNVHEVRQWYAERNVRDLRWSGISGLLPWDQSICWKYVQNSVPTHLNPARFDALKNPGIVPDKISVRGEHLMSPFADFKLSKTGEGFIPNFSEYLGWIAGKASEISENGHNYRAGETVSKTLALLNDSRQDAKVEWSWRVPNLNLEKKGSAAIPAGGKLSVPLEFKLPADAKGEFTIESEMVFENKKKFADKLEISVIPAENIAINSKIGLFDPEGKAGDLLNKLGVKFQTVKTDADVENLDMLILGRNAMANDFPLHLKTPLKGGLKLLVLEQSAETLFRLGLRTTEHGFREVFPIGGSDSVLRDWRGSATQLTPFLDTPEYEARMPMTFWNGFDNSRVWRAGNRGSVTEVPIEKPQVGNWKPLLQCGFDLQYSPLMEFSEGNGKILFCQLSVTARTDSEPEAEEQLRNAISHLEKSTPVKRRPVYYSGGKQGRKLLRDLKIKFKSLKEDTELPKNALLVLGDGLKPEDLTKIAEAGVNVLALGLSKEQLDAAFPKAFEFESGVFYSDKIDGLNKEPLLAGIGNSDLHWRWGKTFDAFANNSAGRTLATRKIGAGAVVAFQTPPWKFDAEEFSERTTCRRSTFAISRLLANLGARADSDFFDLFDGTKGNLRFDLPNDKWIGIADPKKLGTPQEWWKRDFATDSQWRPIRVGENFDTQYPDLAKFDGNFWYRLEFDAPQGGEAIESQLNLGTVDDESWVWLNDKFLGEISKKTDPQNHWELKRSYKLPAGSLKTGKNVLTVLCNDGAGHGGIIGKPRLKIENKNSAYTDIPVASDDPYRYYRW